MGAQLVKEVATKTNDVAGDGTTTATLLAQAIIREGLKNLAAGANPMILRSGIEAATAAAVEGLKEMSVPVADNQAIENVAANSASDQDCEGSSRNMAITCSDTQRGRLVCISAR